MEIVDLKNHTKELNVILKEGTLAHRIVKLSVKTIPVKILSEFIVSYATVYHKIKCF